MPPVRVDTVRLQRISKAFWESAALMSAVELGVFSAISEGNNTIEKVGQTVGINQLNAERLLVALAAMELIERDGAWFTNAPDVERFLVQDSPSFAGPWMLFSKPRWDDWGVLTERLKVTTDQSTRLGTYNKNFDEDSARIYHQATYSVGMGAARRFHKQVDLSQRRKLMDIGGGSGCYCIVGSQAHQNLRAVVLELSAVVPVAREFIAEHGLGEHIEVLACDFTRDDFPTDCDAAVMASNLPQYDRATVGSVIRKVFDALLPGGEFHLIGEMINNTGDGPLAPALWGLSEAISCSRGLAHSQADGRGYFEAAGFVEITLTEVIPQTLTRVSGIKPAP